MKTGFIGAGKVGCSLGKYLRAHGVEVTGYYDRDTQAAAEAAKFTDTACYETAREVAESCDMLFITVPDGLIRTVYEKLRSEPALSAETGSPADPSENTTREAPNDTTTEAPADASAETPAKTSAETPAKTSADPRAGEGVLWGKFLCHCSGSISSREAFPNAAEAGARAYSVHPLFAVSDRFETYRQLDRAYFTVEGDPAHLHDITDFLAKAGLTVRTIDPDSKTRYHLAAVYASNLICALLGQAGQLLHECGFEEEEALEALAPLIRGNVDHVLEVGPARALTGPVERGDAETVRRHLAVCESEEDRDLYRRLSRKALDLARRKHPDRDYAELEEVLGTDR